MQLIILPARECEIHGEDEKLGTVIGGVLEELGPGGAGVGPSEPGATGGDGEQGRAHQRGRGSHAPGQQGCQSSLVHSKKGKSKFNPRSNFSADF